MREDRHRDPAKVYVVSSHDRGGATWGPSIKLSDRSTGAPYKTAAGYQFPYGDYLSLSVDGKGRNHVIWGEGASYDGPGGVWYTRGRSP